MMGFRLGAAMAMTLLAAGAAQGASLDAMLPRAQMACYGGPAAGAHPIFSLVRITRPERFQSYDSMETRMTRLVVNFATPKAKLEDTGTCREKDGEIVCASNSCDGAVFVLREERDGTLRIKFDLDIPRAIWSCADDSLRNIKLRDAERYITVTRGKGTCIPPGWEATEGPE